MTGAVLTTGAGGGGGDVNAAPLPASGGNRFASWRMRSNALRRFSGCTIGAEVVREVFSVAGEAYRQQFRALRSATQKATEKGNVPPAAACV